MLDLEEFAQQLRRHPQRYRSASEYAAVMLREAIMSGAAAPGSPLGQEELAKALAVSRMPIRDALRMLESEGLVTFRAHHGFTVAEFSADQFIEVAEIRFSLEALALRYAIPNHTSETLRSAKDLLFELNKAEKAADRQSRPALHRQFHLSLYGPCEMSRLLALIDTNLVWSESLSRIGTAHFSFVPKRDVHEHGSLVDAVRARDVEGAQRILRAHIVGQAEAIAKQLDEQRTSGAGSKQRADKSQ